MYLIAKHQEGRSVPLGRAANAEEADASITKLEAAETDPTVVYWRAPACRLAGRMDCAEDAT